MTLRGVISVVLVLGVVVAASLWVGAVRFKDEASATDCGVPLGAAWHGREVPKWVVQVSTNMQSANGRSGVFSVPLGDRGNATVCRGEARTRVVIAVDAIVVALGGVLLLNRPWSKPPPPPAAVV